MSFRFRSELGTELKRLAQRRGIKPAVFGAELVEEGIRRRQFPLIDLRETAVGRVAYLKGTRLAVYWIFQAVQDEKGHVDKVAIDQDLGVEKIKAAMHYAETYPEEIASDIAEAEANQRALQAAESACVKWKTVKSKVNPKAGQ